ncbi:MAG: hypothetical protein EOP83_31095 [Verrucomicrobiaceae bacterium]|nr:MAG: hypothetical protein EOP83_31095 [Verrucomicrobiaceae bacterium]
MDALIATLSQFPAIKREDSAKLFFKKFPYKIVLDSYRYEDRKVVTQTSITRSRDEVQVRAQGGYYNVYFRDESTAAEFLSENAKYVVSVALPTSTEALSAISTDTRIEIRDSLYWNKFRWAAVCKSLDLDQIDELRDWLSNFKEQCGEVSDDRIMFSYSTSSPRVYFADEDDLFMFKFSFFNRISRLEKVLLKKEISNEHFSAEGAH